MLSYEDKQVNTVTLCADSSYTGYEFRIRQFMEYSILSSLRQDNLSKCIMQALLGISASPWERLNGEMAEDKVQPMTREQEEVLKYLLGGTPVLFQQAPAGTGKRR